MKKWIKGTLKGMIFMSLLCAMIMPMKAEATTWLDRLDTLEVNHEYSISQLPYEYDTAMYRPFEFECAFEAPESGRVRVWIKNAPSGMFSDPVFKLSEQDGENWSYRDVDYATVNVESTRTSWNSIKAGSHTTMVWLCEEPTADTVFYIEYQKKSEYIGEEEDNDTFDTANLITAGSAYEGNYSKDYDVDYYKFEMVQPGTVEINVGRTMGTEPEYNIAYTMYQEDANYNVDELFSVEDFDEETQKRRLGKGSYYIKMEKTQEYRLQVNITEESAETHEQEPNNTSSNANVKALNVKYIGNLNDAEDRDWYRYTLTEESDVSLQFWIPRQTANGLVEATLYNEELSAIETIITTDDPFSETETHRLPAGNYYVCINNTYQDMPCSNLYDYSVMLKAVEPSEDGPQSVEKPKRVAFVQVGAQKRKMIVMWEQVKGADGYQITYSTNKKFKNAKKVTIKRNDRIHKTIKKLKRGKTYYVKVRAYKKTDEGKIYGAYSKVKRARIR